MALKDTILQEVQAGRLQPHWTTSDLLKNQNISRSYPNTKTLETYPLNYSASLPGLNLREGHNVTDQPVFYRVGRRGRALLFALPEHRTVSQQAKPATPATSVAEKKRPKNQGGADKQEPPPEQWTVKSDMVSGFINWLVDKERKRAFCFSYTYRNNKFKAKTIEEAANKYSWPSDKIPPPLVAGLPGFAGNRVTTLEETIGLLKSLREELRDSLRKEDSFRHLKACWATLYWGGVANEKNLSFYGLRYISDCNNLKSRHSQDGLIGYHKAAHDLDNKKLLGWFDPEKTNEDKLEEHVKDMSAGITKIHSLLADELVIYDSRVACALAWLVERYCDEKEIAVQDKGELHFSLPAPRKSKQTERDPAKVRQLEKNSIQTIIYQPPDPKRWARDKLRASLILSEVLKGLGKTDQQERTDSFLKYQLGLFMIGYHLGDHDVK